MEINNIIDAIEFETILWSEKKDISEIERCRGLALSILAQIDINFWTNLSKDFKKAIGVNDY